MANSTDTFAAAVRAVLASTDRRDDMREVARDALRMLDEGLVLEAAVSHIASLARRLHNDEVRERGRLSVSSDEVVNVRGADVALGTTTEQDREFLIANRQSLARGLFARAERLREFGAAGMSLIARVASRDALDAEARADRAERMAEALQALTADLGTGHSVAEREVAEELNRIRKDIESVGSEVSDLRAAVAKMIEHGDIGPIRWTRTRRAVKRLGRFVGVGA